MKLSKLEFITYRDYYVTNLLSFMSHVSSKKLLLLELNGNPLTIYTWIFLISPTIWKFETMS